MSPDQLDTIVTALNLVGLPMVAIWAAHRGYLVTGREMKTLSDQYTRLQSRYELLEERMREEQSLLRQELEATRSQLIELLIRGEIRERDADL